MLALDQFLFTFIQIISENYIIVLLNLNIKCQLQSVQNYFLHFQNAYEPICQKINYYLLSAVIFAINRFKNAGIIGQYVTELKANKIKCISKPPFLVH